MSKAAPSPQNHRQIGHHPLRLYHPCRCFGDYPSPDPRLAARQLASLHPKAKSHPKSPQTRAIRTRPTPLPMKMDQPTMVTLTTSCVFAHLSHESRDHQIVSFHARAAISVPFVDMKQWFSAILHHGSEMLASCVVARADIVIHLACVFTSIRNLNLSCRKANSRLASVHLVSIADARPDSSGESWLI